MFRANIIKKYAKYLSLFSLIIFLSINASCSFIDDVLDVEFNDTYSGAIPGQLRFIAIGDTGKGNQEQYKVARAMQKKCAQDGCDFVLVLGDNIYGSGVDDVIDPQFQSKFELPYKDIDLPFFMVLGNHDYGGGGAGYEAEKSIHQIRYTEVSKKWKMPRHYYQFQAEETGFFALDTTAQMYLLDDRQEKDVSRWISDSTANWKIAFGHHPYRSNGRHGNAGFYDSIPVESAVSGKGVKDFSESVWCGKVDLYLAGHDHNRQWLKDTCQGTQLAVSGAGASTTRLVGDNPVLFEKDALGFLYIYIKGNTLKAEFVDEEGNTDFTHVINK